MPWCEDCVKYWAPSAMHEDGTCPTCGRSLDQPVRPAKPRVTAKSLNLHELAAGEDRDEEDMRAPWHFKLMMVLLVIYLTWRIYQLLT